MPVLTSDQAREMAISGVAKRVANYAEAKAKARAYDAMIQRQLVQAQEPETSPAMHDDAADGPTKGYLGERLLRVRKQIASLERRIEDLLEGDPSENASAIDRLCAAKAKLSEEERILAGRPLPGSHRPRQTSGPRRPSSADPLAE